MQYLEFINREIGPFFALTPSLLFRKPKLHCLFQIKKDQISIKTVHANWSLHASCHSVKTKARGLDVTDITCKPDQWINPIILFPVCGNICLPTISIVQSIALITKPDGPLWRIFNDWKIDRFCYKLIPLYFFYIL